MKVIAFWGGRRRCQYRRRAGRRVPFQYHVPGWDSEYAFRMLKRIIEAERDVDKGVECDTLIVQADWWNGDDTFSTGAVEHEDIHWLMRQSVALRMANGTRTRNGTIRVETRENIGLSFGSFNHAYAENRHRYKWWFFTEDDYMFLQPNYVLDGIIEMANSESLGFLAYKRGHRVKRKRYAPGGIGLGRAEALDDAYRANTNARHPDGHLPYYHARGYDKQIELGEIRFTTAITKAGWDLGYVDQECWTHWTEQEKPRQWDA